MNANMAKCLLVSKVLVADGMVTEDERSFLAALMTRFSLSDAERQRVIDLESWDEAEPLVSALSIEEKEELVEMLLDAASADGKLSGHEHEAIKRVSKALGL
ncbi:MAG: TerB family tellurite resistance protein [Kofleriaceae bacterium]|nr:TerB family tellurite resistance protein [Kofleriaceae bacterium]